MNYYELTNVVLSPESAQAITKYVCEEYFNQSRYGSDQIFELAKEVLSRNFAVSWSGGGTYGSCFTDDLTEVDPDDEPEMKELKEFLLHYCPHLDYKTEDKIFYAIHESTHYDSDYYGGSMSSYSKYISIEEIISIIEEDEEGEIFLCDMLQDYLHYAAGTESYEETREKILFKDSLENNLSIKSKPLKRKI